MMKKNNENSHFIGECFRFDVLYVYGCMCIHYASIRSTEIHNDS